MKLRPSYKPMEITLIKKDLKKVDLRNNIDVSSSTLARMAKSEPVSLAVIIKICEFLECDLHDVVELIEVEDNES
ncbi:helix-turn-helix domain-containing protein [Bacillus atrophaeus]|uniref:helix-turn-helix domain-containing protein n=1 Tax=Bacillus atrophaeus TaxID=1452 RepID=UPI002282ED8A|nr:helix-turn-helix domain-containing protein [Bacillus atrophaeus]MCY8911052.1 helix-turn-helix domain-containing protein [Bacillus atrophaeus]MEC0836365.1 helix-turn-helix domain-containing protein [Bacillus atrophaeus]MEC0846585.1 helix-turn-helix domain-containing protein [Bacillus atrophaeus]MEC0850883.1 helix-turn-helix domain-containing protein [Bacillus atrophaeus]MEC0867629.1 helix-turn-helix domain-containing protein [Bacillus atrophaeus]